MSDLGLEKTYCDICKFEFADVMAYYIHENECHLKTVKLSVANEKGWSTTLDVSQERDGTYACKKCCIYFSNSRMLQLHLESKCMKTEAVKNTYCELCETSLTNSECLYLHNKQYHNKNDDRAMNTSPENEHLELSAFSRTKEGHFICPNCDAPFPSTKSILHHLKHSCIANEDEYYCNLCDNTFPYMRSLRDHYDSIHVQVIKVRDPSDPTFHKEISVERNDNGAFCCPTCHIGYELATSFKNHMKQSCLETKSLLMCEICSRYFGGSTGLTVHKFDYHHREINIKGIYLKDYNKGVSFIRDEDDDFLCPSCPFVTNKSSMFKAHVRKKPCSTGIIKKISRGTRFNISEQSEETVSKLNIQKSQDPPYKRIKLH